MQRVLPFSRRLLYISRGSDGYLGLAMGGIPGKPHPFRFTYKPSHNHQGSGKGDDGGGNSTRLHAYFVLNPTCFTDINKSPSLRDLHSLRFVTRMVLWILVQSGIYWH